MSQSGHESTLAEDDDLTSKLTFVPTESGAARSSSIQSSRHGVSRVDCVRWTPSMNRPMIRTVCTACGCDHNVVWRRRSRTAGAGSARVRPCVQGIVCGDGGVVAGAGEILGTGRSAPGSSFGAQWLPARRRFVRNRENRRLSLTGADKTLDRMRFTSVSEVHLQGHDRWSYQFDHRTGRAAMLRRANSNARAATAEHAWVR